MNSESLNRINVRPGKKDQALKQNLRQNHRLIAGKEAADERYCFGSVCETSWKPTQNNVLPAGKSS